METSKEELESTNEELTTVNEEMANRNTELNRLNSDLGNLQTSTKLAIVLLGRDLTIRRFSAQAEKQFNLLATDLGCPISNIRHNLVFPERDEDGGAHAPRVSVAAPRLDESGRRARKKPVGEAPAGTREARVLPETERPPDLESFIAEVIETVREREQEVRDKDGRWYSLRVRPYMTLDNKVDGAVLVLVDINDLKRTEREIKAARDYAEATLRTARNPLLVLRGDLRVNTANEAFHKTFKTTPDQAEGRLIYELGNRQWDIPQLRILLEDILPRNSFFNDFEITNDFPHIGRRTMLLNARRLDLDDGTLPMILLAIEDVTERMRASEATTKLAAIVQTTDDAIFTKTLDGVITSWNPGAERMFGYSSKEIVGKNVSVLTPPARADELERMHEKLRRGERVTNFETERMRRNGSIIGVSLGIAPLVDGKGQLTGASVIERDITERKRAADQVRVSEIRFRRLFEVTHDGVLILDSVSRKITEANSFIADLLGYTREELLGQELWEIGLLKDEPASHAAFRELQQKGQIRYEDLPLETKSGRKREVEVVANRYEEDGKQVIQCNIRDITKRKRAEEALRQSHAELRSHAEELDRFNRVAVGREVRMIELKKELNELCQRQGEAARYPLEFEQDGKDTDA